MSALEIRTVGVDDPLLEPWHASMTAAQRAEVGDAASVWTLPELVELLGSGVRSREEPVAATLDGEVVGAGLLSLPVLDNLGAAELYVGVPPEHRRRGYGAALLDHMEDRARAEGRSRLDAEVSFPYDHGPDATGTSGHDFAVAHGYRFGLGDVQRELRGHVPEERLAELAASAAQRHAAYQLRAWSGPLPDDLVEGWLALNNTLMTEAPTGEMEREQDGIDVDAQRRVEEVQRRQGRTNHHTVALSADGEVVAYSHLVTTVHEPDRAYQWGTLVRRDHRGHRLGLAVKVANHRLLQREAPQVVRVTTWNAEENTHMIAVNELLGFEPVARLAELQKRV